jgi:hypothetical protein
MKLERRMRVGTTKYFGIQALTRRFAAPSPGGRGTLSVLCSFVLLLTVACANTDYRFERIDGDQAVALPLKLAGFYGLRDGALVKAEANFVDGSDSVVMNIVLFLRPPAEFQSGTYQASIGGRMTSGAVDCPSLTFQGGQTALPNVGGLFILKDADGRPLYRVRIPATMLSGRGPR